MSTLHPPKHPPVIRSLLTIVLLFVLLAGCAGPAQAPTEQAQPTAAAAEPTTAPPTEAQQPTEKEAAPAEATATTGPTDASTEPTEDPYAADANYSPEIPDPTEPVTITFASWVHGDADAWESMAERFHELHPNITIEFQDVPFEEMHDKLVTQIAANNPPDAAYIDASMVAEFSSRNALVSLDNYVAQSQAIDLEDYVEAFLRSAKFEGKLYGLPIDGESTGLFYRIDRFEEAGLDPNKPPKTWDEFQLYAEKLTNVEEKKYGTIVFANEAAYYFYPWLWQAGGDTLAANGTDVIWDSPEGQEAANFYVNLAKYSPPDFLASNSWDGRVAFANGDVAMYVAGAWFAGTLLTEFPDETGKWATAPLPENKRCATTIAGENLVVFSASKNPEAAYKWIEFVSAPHNMATLNLGTPEAPATLLPPRISLLEDPKTYEGRPFLKGFADNMKCAVVSDVVQPRYGEMEAFLTEYLGEAMYGNMDGATAVKQAAEEAEALIK